GLEAGHPPDVVLLDMHMPVLDGYRTATLLREIGYRGTIVALTGSVGEVERQKCIDAGCDEHAAKPIHRLRLLLMLSRISDHAGKAEAACPTPAAADAAAAADADTDESTLEPCEPLESTLATDPIIQPMLQQVLAGFGARQARLEQALEKSDLMEVARVAHDLTGLGGTFGYDELTVRAKQLARALKERDPPEAVDVAAKAVLRVCRRILAAKARHDAA
ncbi:MAG TPA: response regulator, partial [Polyangiaceae bacterium]|nr:response regulator [Polyangiaceae bacterium]